MKIVAFDTETSLIRPGLTAPPISCLSYQEHDVATRKSKLAVLVHWTAALAKLREWLSDPECILVGHNVAFDLAVVCAEWPELVPLVFVAYEQNRVTDTMLRQKLLDIAQGCYRGYQDEETFEWKKLGYTLLELARRCVGLPIKKEGFRLFYGPLRNVAFEHWVDGAQDLQKRGAAYLDGAKDDEIAALEAALGDSKKFRGPDGLAGMVSADPSEVISYPLDDARSTLAVYLAQEEFADPYLADQFPQSRRAWWLHLTSAWGLRTHAPSVAALQMQTQRLVDQIEQQLRDAGLVRADGSRDTKLAKQRMLDVCGWEPCPEGWLPDGAKPGEQIPFRPRENRRHDLLPLRLTPAKEPSLDADACAATEDDLLVAYAELTSLKAVLNKDVPALARAVIYPVHTHFDLAETGRTTSSNPNVQNWRRLPGIRECFVPRPGRVFAQADYSGLELATLAQACIDLLGRSTLADVLNAGKDPHTDLAALILGITYEEGVARKAAKDHEFDNARQTSKVANFGFPGGLGPAKLCLFARKTYGVELTEDQAKELKEVWLAKWPEMRDYFAHVKSLPSEKVADRVVYTLEQLRSKRVRGGASYTAACNSYFQGLGADATGHAGWLIAWACYVDRESPLFGARIVNYVHDEMIVEVDEDGASEAADELSRLMVKGAQKWIPDIVLKAEPCLMRVWSKDAKTIRDANGRLIPWAPA